MARFIFTTNAASSITHQAVIERYTIYNLQPFEVRLKEDIDYFRDNTKRFKEVNRFEKVKKPKDIDEKLKEELSTLELSKEVIDNIVELYISKENLKQTVEENLNLDQSIPEEAQEIIKKHIIGEIPNVEEENPKEEEVKTTRKKKKKKKKKLNKVI